MEIHEPPRVKILRRKGSNPDAFSQPGIVISDRQTEKEAEDPYAEDRLEGNSGRNRDQFSGRQRRTGHLTAGDHIIAARETP